MVVKTKDKEGNEVLMFDPSAVYLDPDELDDSQARFRIFGQAKLRRAGLKIVQDKYGDDEDYLISTFSSSRMREASSRFSNVSVNSSTFFSLVVSSCSATFTFRLWST